MKKLVLTLLTIVSTGGLFALPVGNPSDASLLTDGLLWEGCYPNFCDPCTPWFNCLSYRIGFYGDYVFNRHMKVQDHTHNAWIEHTQIFTNAALFVVNFYERVDLFATLGATNFFINTNAIAFGGPSGRRIEIESDTNFSWSLGIHGTLWECGCTTLGAEAQYFYTRPQIRRITIGATDSIYNDGVLGARFREWQIGLGLSQRINMFIPYLAIKWGSPHLSMGNAFLEFEDFDASLFALNGQKTWGWALGITFVNCEMISVTVEGRFASEKALHVNGQIRF